jgi:hypothetical protein
MSAYNIFKDNHNLTDKQRIDALQDIVESAADNVIYECSSAERNYRHNNDKLFPGVNNILAVVDNDLFQREVFNYILKTANNLSVSRSNHISGFDLVYGEAHNPEEVDIVKNNVASMKEQIFRICNEVKDDVITKFDLLNMQKSTNDLGYEGHLVPRVQACIKDHDYKILTAQEKVAEKMKFVTDMYPEENLREYVKDIYIKDLKEQLKCADSIMRSNINEYQNAFHAEFKDLIVHAEPDTYGQSRYYGCSLTRTGKTLLDVKAELANKMLENVNDNFEVFYASVAKHVTPHIKEPIKLSIIEKLKNATFGSNFGESVDIGADVHRNELLNIQKQPEKDIQKPKFKM